MAGLAPPSGDTSGSRGDAGAGGGQAYRRHTGCHLHWGGQPQKGDVIVEVLGVVVGVSDGPGNGLDLNWLTAGLTIVLSQDNTVASRRHTAVSSSDNPVLVDQGSPTEVESPTILK